MDASPKSASSMMHPWIDRFLGGSYRHFACWLPPKLGLLTSWWMRIFFRGITVSDAQIQRLRDLDQQGLIVFGSKYKSYFDFLFYHTRYRQLDLPFPEIGLDYRVFSLQTLRRLLQIGLANLVYFFRHLSLPDPYESGYIQDEIRAGKAAFVSLIEKRGFYKRFVKAKKDPLQYLVELQATEERPLFIVIQQTFFSRRPPQSIPSITDIFFGSQERPKLLRRLFALFRKPGTVFTEMAQPINVKQFLESPDCRGLAPREQAQHLRRHLVLVANRLRQSIIGPMLKTQEEIKQNVLTGPRLQDFMKQHAANRNLSLYAVHREANAYLDEIMAKLNMAVIRTGDVAIRWIIEHMFEGVSYRPEEMEELKAMAQNAPLVFIPCHKSHIDYLIISYVLFNNKMPCPLIAAGKNLSFWPLGPIFRGGGAFFIRRTFRGAVLYSKVFSEYIYRLLAEGFNIEFFIEGGRSRTGKLILPKLGLLSILLNAHKDGACEDLVIVPIFIGYDRVLEERAYLDELDGGKKEPENIRQVFKASRFLKKRYGRIYLNFGRAMSVNDLLVQWNPTGLEMPQKDFNAFTRNLGHRVINAINVESVITPYALTASAILTRPKQRFSHRALMTHIDTFLRYLFSQNAKLSDTLLLDPIRAVEEALDAYVQRKFIERGEDTVKDGGPPNRWYAVNESRRPHLEFYKNNCINAFIPAAFSALAILEQDAFQFGASDLYNGYRFLQDLFKNEFAYDVDKTPEQYVRKTVKAFIDDAILMPHPTLPDRYNITSAGFRKLKYYSRFLKPYLESYWIVITHFAEDAKEGMSSKERIKKIQSLANRMHKQHQVELRESLSKINFANALDFFSVRGVRGPENREAIERYRTAIQRYLLLQ